MEQHQQSARIDLAPTVTASRAARDVITGLLVEQPADSTAVALLLTSELVTNAVTHTGAECTLRAKFDPILSWLRVEVADASSHVPGVPAEVNTTRVGGHGLRIVATVAHKWGVASTHTGKVMWFELGGR